MNCSHFNAKTNVKCTNQGYVYDEKDQKSYCKRHFFNKEMLTNTCPICFEDYGNKQHHILLKCDHLFHQKCLNDWVSHGGNTCPVCRTSLFCHTFEDEYYTDEDEYEIEEVNIINMSHEEAVNALNLFFNEGYSLPNNTINNAMSILHWSFSTNEH